MAGFTYLITFASNPLSSGQGHVTAMVSDRAAFLADFVKLVHALSTSAPETKTERFGQLRNGCPSDDPAEAPRRRQDWRGPCQAPAGRGPYTRCRLRRCVVPRTPRKGRNVSARQVEGWALHRAERRQVSVPFADTPNFAIRRELKTVCPGRDAICLPKVKD